MHCDERSDRRASWVAKAAKARRHSERHLLLDLINNRLIIAPTETRAAIGRYEGGTFHLFVTAASVHAIRDHLAAVFRRG